MKLNELIDLRKLRGDKTIVIRINGYEKKYRVWQVAEDDKLGSKYVVNEWYKPINDTYGVTLKA